MLARKNALLWVGKETQGKRTDLESDNILSTIGKESHNTRETIAKEIGWSTGKVAQPIKSPLDSSSHTPDLKIIIDTMMAYMIH